MALMISVSGMRGVVGRDLDPGLVVRHAAALGAWAAEQGNPLVVLGRDARTSGPTLARAAAAGLLGVGCDVIELGIVPTPTVQLAVEHHHAGAGLVLSASHNPIEWNALKFIGPDGVFLDAGAGARVRAIAERGPPWAAWDGIGTVREDPDAVTRHLDRVLALPWVEVETIRARGFHVALDCVRGAGGVAIPPLLERLGCRVSGIHLETDGRFPRNPEPVPEHLTDLGDLVRQTGADIGMAVDPDVDRLALVDETGRPIGEDYTLAFAVRAVLSSRAEREIPVASSALGRDSGGQTVVANLSTSLVVEDAARELGARFVRAPVGEAHVARVMREEGALIGGEGNGGVMLPALHMGRDAPAGVALVLQYLARAGQPVSVLVRGAAQYRIVKARAPLGGSLEEAYGRLRKRFPEADADARDGLRLAWPGRWVHVRPSGTEPIVRLIAEAPVEDEAMALVAACRELMEGGAR
jgi:phosphomannomutase